MPKRAAVKGGRRQKGKGKGKKMKGAGFWDDAMNVTSRGARGFAKALPSLALGYATGNPWLAAQGVNDFAGDVVGDQYSSIHDAAAPALEMGSMYGPGGFFGKRLGRAKKASGPKSIFEFPSESSEVKPIKAPATDLLGREHNPFDPVPISLGERNLAGLRDPWAGGPSTAASSSIVGQRLRGSLSRLADRSRAIGRQVRSSAGNAYASLKSRLRRRPDRNAAVLARARQIQMADRDFVDLSEPLLG